MKRIILTVLVIALVLPLLLLVALHVAPPAWLGPQASKLAQRFSGQSVSMRGLDLNPLSRRPNLRIDDLEVRNATDEPVVEAGELSAAIKPGELLRGTLLIEHLSLDEATLSLAIDEDGTGNWASLLPATSTDPQPAESDKQPPSLPLIERLTISDTTLTIDDASRGHSGVLDIDASGSTTSDSEPLTISAKGQVNTAPVSIQASAESLRAAVQGDPDLDVAVDATLGDTRLELTGSIGDPSSFRQLDIDMVFDAPGLSDIETLTGLALPVLPPFDLTATLLRDGDEFVLQRFDSNFGESVFEGDVRANPATTPPTLYANVIANVLDLDDLAGLLGGTPDETESIDPEAEPAPATEAPGRVLPNAPIAFTALTRIANGAINFRANTVRSTVWPIDAMELGIELLPDRLKLMPLSLGVGGGEVEGSLDTSVASSPAETVLELRLKRIDLKAVMRAAGLDNDAFGTIGGRAKYWMQGETVADLAGSADGGLFLLMTDGKVDALLTELAGIDLVETMSVLFSEGDTNTDISCAYADIHSSRGVTTLQKFVIDTADTVFLADGTINLDTEAMDLVLEPHPKDVSLLAARTSVNIGGTLAKPSLSPGPALPLRAAAAAVLATVAAPAAALIPFIQPGSGEDSPYCEGLATSLDDAR